MVFLLDSFFVYDADKLSVVPDLVSEQFPYGICKV